MPSNDEGGNPGQQRYINRRRALRYIGGAGVAGLAGCSGNSGSQTTTSSDSAGQNGTAGGKSGSSKDFSDVTFEYWDTFNVASETARPAIQKVVDRFEKDTGATVKMNWSGYTQLSGTKWLNAFRRGKYPTLYLGEPPYTGRFRKWIKPYREWKEWLNDDVVSNLEWLTPIMEQISGPLETTQWEAPVGLLTFGFIARADHYDQAGMDINKRFPPNNYDELVDQATTLQKKGPGKWGHEITGSKFDNQEYVNSWTVPQSHEKGQYLKPDWSDVNWNNEIFIDVTSKMQDLVQKHQVSSPSSVNKDFEQVIPQLMSGQVSSSLGGFPTMSVMMNRYPDLMTSGKIRWGPTWKGESGERAPVNLYTMGITKPPKNADPKKWERKQRAAAELVNRMLSKNFQRQQVRTIGNPPARQDVWKQARDPNDSFELVKGENKHHYADSVYKVVNVAKSGWDYHDSFVSFYVHIPAAYITQMLKGQITPEQANKKIYDECQKLL